MSPPSSPSGRASSPSRSRTRRPSRRGSTPGRASHRCSSSRATSPARSPTRTREASTRRRRGSRCPSSEDPLVVHETVVLEGHLIDSDILRRVFDRVVEGGGEFEVVEFRVGRTNQDPSFARIAVRARDPQALDAIVEGLRYVGAVSEAGSGDCVFAPAEADGILPDEFYSTANFDTWVRVGGRWLPAEDQKMDCALVLREGRPRCIKQGRVKKGEPVALRGPGIRVRPPERSRDYSVFGFMSNEVSAEVNKAIAISGTAREMRRVRAAGEKIVAVAGPAV